MRRPHIVLALLLAIARPVHADWGPGGVPIAQTLVGGEIQFLRGVVSDGSGGVHVGWLRNYFDSSFHQTFEWLVGSRLNSLGVIPPGWPALGVDYDSWCCSSLISAEYDHLLEDGTGGAIRALTYRSGVQRHVEMRHVTFAGAVGPFGSFGAFGPFLVSAFSAGGDGTGGVVWAAYAPSGALFVQRVSPAGVVQWSGSGGVPGPQVVPPGQGDPNPGLRVAADGQGGMFVAWIDRRDVSFGSIDPDLYVHHVLSDGTIAPGWPANGVEVGGASGAPDQFAIVLDGSGGVFASWRDSRTGVPTPYFSHVRASGVLDPLIPTGGLEIPSPPGADHLLAASADAQGGAIILRAGAGIAGGWDFFIHRLSESGLPWSGWPSSGRALSASSAPSVQGSMIADGSGGAFVAFQQSGSRLFGQHIGHDGQVAAGWPAPGIEFGSGTTPSMVRSGLGVIVVWRQSPISIRAQQLLPDGPVAVAATLVSARASTSEVELRWYVTSDVGGIGAIERRTEAGDWSHRARLEPDGEGHVVFVDRDVTPRTRYAYRLTWEDRGSATVFDEVWVETDAEPSFALEPPQPNPVVGPFQAHFSLPYAGGATIEVLDLAGRRVASRDLSDYGAGRHAVPLDLGPSPQPGIYVVRLHHASGSRHVRFALVR
jgi:hypothetical protein